MFNEREMSKAIDWLFELFSPEDYEGYDEDEIGYDGANRVADFICGGLADFNYEDGSVTGEKQCTLLEDVISDNEYLVIFDIHEKGVARITHRKK